MIILGRLTKVFRILIEAETNNSLEAHDHDHDHDLKQEVEEGKQANFGAAEQCLEGDSDTVDH